MKDIKFNYYLETKDNVIKMFESYFAAKTKQYEEIQEKRKPYTEKIEKYKQIINEKSLKQQQIKTSIERANWKKRNELDQEKTRKLKKIRENAEKKSDITRTVILIALFAWIIIDSGLIDGIFLSIIIFPIVMFIMSFFEGKESRSVKTKIKKTYNEYDSKIKDMKSIPDEYYEYGREIEQLKKELKVLQIKLDDIEYSKIDLRKKFNIPREIIGYEYNIYEWLVKNRVNSFNEALDKLDEYKHREEMERMQRDQYIAAQNLENQVQRELDNINKRFDDNIGLVKEVKNLASNALSAAKDAATAAKHAEYAAYDAGYEAKQARKSTENIW